MGWQFDAGVLIFVVPGLPPMHRGTAACLIAVGAGLALLALRRPPRLLIAGLGVAVVLACGYFILREVAHFPVAGRMSALTAMSLASAGVGLAIAALQGEASALGVASMPAIAFSLCSLLGHALGQKTLNVPFLDVSNQMALNTALGLLAWSAGAWGAVRRSNPVLLAWNWLPVAAATGGLTLMLGLEVVSDAPGIAARVIDLGAIVSLPAFCFVVAKQLVMLRARRVEAEAATLAFASTLEGMARLDPAGRTVWVNQALVELLGDVPASFPGSLLSERLEFSSRLRFGHAVAEARRTGKAAVEVAARRKDGSGVWLEVKLVLTADPFAPEIRVFLRDVSARKAAERIKDEFLGVLAHDIRNPLSAIGMALEMLRDDAIARDSTQRARLLKVMESSLEKLDHLSREIIERERLASGFVPVAAKSCAAKDLMRSAAEAVWPLADEAGVAVVISGGDGMIVHADPVRTLQIFSNLLENALKASPPGTTVSVSVQAQEAEALFCVADQGPGIPPDKIATIFERFEQLEAERSAGTSHGLGLAICRSLVERQGGLIWAESDLGAGSRFMFTLPLAGVAVTA